MHNNKTKLTEEPRVSGTFRNTAIVLYKAGFLPLGNTSYSLAVYLLIGGPWNWVRPDEPAPMMEFAQVSEARGQV